MPGYNEPQLYADLPDSRRAVVNAAIATQKRRLQKLKHAELRTLLVTHGLADNEADALTCMWSKPEMVFELASLIVELNEPS